MKFRYLFAGAVLVAGCATSTKTAMPRTPSSDNAAFTLKNGGPWNISDPELPRSDLTIWTLQEMANKGQIDALNQLFDHGLSMDSLPHGFAAGAAARVLDIGGLEGFTGDNWRGKIFDDFNDPMNSTGRNRIRKNLILPSSQIIPMAQFVTQLVPSCLQIQQSPNCVLVPTATSNIVVINYANPITKLRSRQELLLKNVVQVYDVMVAVPGKYGPVYIGKTWLGNYDAQNQFHAVDPKSLIAWFFLDFNEGALEEQKTSHWQGGNWDVNPASIRKAQD